MKSITSYQAVSHRQNLEKADFWVKYLSEQLKGERDLDEIRKKEQVLISLTNEDLKDVARECLKN